MTLTTAPNLQIAEHRCPDCAQPFRRITGFVHRDGAPYAVFYASCHHHDGNDVLLDAIFGTWEGDDQSDHVTFGCRIGPVPGQPGPAVQLIPAAVSFEAAPLFGHKLSREEAQGHPRFDDFRELVQHVLSTNTIIGSHLSAAPQS
ncbi:hypothetical protein [Jiangella alkaliphila]|uniref:Uncharacterized protein n=1 Tax=Jiangella alkaliphila TaxID=419479 RepID=A0A1H2JPA8_9ACTN|nr:hypothetical protein [Jiangella alkaliphila]SDU57966.1 hypothetical protein SAMN04488563_2897 [Jiangella alkaliphila]